MTQSITPPFQPLPDLLTAVTNKDALHRVGVFVAWMHARRGVWLRPDLAAYRDYLLQERGLAPASAAAHLSTVRGPYSGTLLVRA